MEIKAYKTHLVVSDNALISKDDVSFFYDRYSKVYDIRFGIGKSGKHFDNRRIKKLQKALSVRKTDTVLDLGCGTGLFTFSFVNKARRVIGIDISNKMLEIARTKAKKMKVKNVKFLKGDVEKLPIKSDSVDKIVFGGILEHAFNPKAVVKEMHRVLRKGGVAVGILPNKESPWFAFLRPLIRGYKKDMPQTRFYSAYEASLLFRRVNFNEVAISIFGFIPPGDTPDIIFPIAKGFERILEVFPLINNFGGLLLIRAVK